MLKNWKADKLVRLQLTGTIPSFLGDIKTLEALKLRDNNVSTFPVSPRLVLCRTGYSAGGSEWIAGIYY